MSRALARPADPGGAKAVAALINAFQGLDGLLPPVPTTAARVRRDLLGPAPGAVLRVAKHAGSVAGFATGGLTHDAERAADAMMVLDLYVVSPARRRGLGRALMDGLAAGAGRRGAACPCLGVDNGDNDATAFNRGVGGETAKHFTGHLPDGAAMRRLAEEATA